MSPDNRLHCLQGRELSHRLGSIGVSLLSLRVAVDVGITGRILRRDGIEGLLRAATR